MRIGLREANQRFSKAIKAVKAGQEVILTERGKPIAVIKSLTKGRSASGHPAVGSRRDIAAGRETRAYAHAELETDSCKRQVHVADYQ